MRKDAFWFGEAQSRVVISVSQAQLNDFKKAALISKVDVTELGKVSTGSISVNAVNWGSINDWKNKYDTAIEKLIN